jgi:ribosomal protein L16/L10AE
LNEFLKRPITDHENPEIITLITDVVENLLQEELGIEGKPLDSKEEVKTAAKDAVIIARKHVHDIQSSVVQAVKELLEKPREKSVSIVDLTTEAIKMAQEQLKTKSENLGFNITPEILNQAASHVVSKAKLEISTVATRIPKEAMDQAVIAALNALRKGLNRKELGPNVAFTREAAKQEAIKTIDDYLYNHSTPNISKQEVQKGAEEAVVTARKQLDLFPEDPISEEARKLAYERALRIIRGPPGTIRKTRTVELGGRSLSEQAFEGALRVLNEYFTNKPKPNELEVKAAARNAVEKATEEVRSPEIDEKVRTLGKEAAKVFLLTITRLQDGSWPYTEIDNAAERAYHRMFIALGPDKQKTIDTVTVKKLAAEVTAEAQTEIAQKGTTPVPEEAIDLATKAAFESLRKNPTDFKAASEAALNSIQTFFGMRAISKTNNEINRFTGTAIIRAINMHPIPQTAMEAAEQAALDVLQKTGIEKDAYDAALTSLDNFYRSVYPHIPIKTVLITVDDKKLKGGAREALDNAKLKLPKKQKGPCEIRVENKYDSLESDFETFGLNKDSAKSAELTKLRDKMLTLKSEVEFCSFETELDAYLEKTGRFKLEPEAINFANVRILADLKVKGGLKLKTPLRDVLVDKYIVYVDTWYKINRSGKINPTMDQIRPTAEDRVDHFLNVGTTNPRRTVRRVTPARGGGLFRKTLKMKRI